MLIELIVGLAVTWPIVGLVFGAPLSNLAWRLEKMPEGTFLPYVEPVNYPDGSTR